MQFLARLLKAILIFLSKQWLKINYTIREAILHLQISSFLLKILKTVNSTVIEIKKKLTHLKNYYFSNWPKQFFLLLLFNVTFNVTKIHSLIGFTVKLLFLPTENQFY